MYNGGFGNQPGFSIQNYAPVDPMAGIPGFQAPAPVQPPQLQHQAPGPSASSSAGAPVRTSQATSGTANTVAKDVRGTRHYSTEEMRRDLDNSVPYIPTPINNPPVGVGSLESQRRQAAPQQQVSGHPAASADSQRRTNQQPPQYDARIDIRALHMMPNQNHQVTPVRPQHPGQGIPDPRMLPPMPAQVLTQTILANMARLPMPPVQVNAPLQPTLPTQHAQRPPILLPPPPEGTTRVQEYPDICVFNEGHPRYSTDLLMNSHMFKIVDFVSYAMNTGIQLSQRTCHLIRERLPPSRRDILPATGLQGPPAAPNVVPPQDNRVMPPGPNVQPSRPPIPNVANLSVPPLPVPPQLRAPNQHLIPQHPPPGILMAPPNAHQVQPGNMNPAATQEQILQWNRQQQFHQLQQRQHQLIQEQQQLQQQHQQRQQQQQQNLQRQQQQQQQQFQQQNLQLQQQQLQQQQQQRTQGPPATQQSQNLPSHFPQSVLDQQRIAPQQQPPAPHQIQNHQQQHQQHMQQLQQHQQFQQHQILHQMQHQQHQLHLQQQQRAELQQQQRQVQEKQGSSSNPQPTEPSLPPTSNAVFSSSDPQSTVADAPHFIAADDAAPPCAYSPTSSPPLTASPEETAEVKPTIPVREKPPKKKRIEVITLEDDPPVRVKQEPVEEVSSTSDAQRKGASPVRNTNIKQEEDNTVPDAPTNEPNQQPNNPTTSAVSVKPEPVEEARPSAVAQKSDTEAQASHPRPEVTQEEVDRRAMLLLKEWKKTICEKNPELAKLLDENPELANLEDFDCKSVQESIVSTSLPAISNPVRSRSSSECSDDIITLRKKKKVDDVKEEESDDNEDMEHGSPQPSTSAGPSRIDNASKNQNSRPEKRNVTFEESDDDMLLIQKKKKRGSRRSSEESEEWRDDGRHTVSSEEEEEEVEEEDWEDSRFVVDDDEDSEVEEDEIDDEGNLADFVVEDDFIEMEEDSSDEERRRYTREKKESRRSSKQATKRRTPVRESAKRHSPKPSERAGNVRKSKSTEERRRRSTEDTPPPSAPPMSEERRKMLKRQERMHKAEERRLGKQLEKKARLSEAHALKDQKFNNLHRGRNEQRKEVPAPLNKRTTSAVSSDNDDGDGVHVPAKRMAHANSVPGPSRDRPMSSQPVRRNHPNQNDLEGRRYAEADEKKKKLQEEYAKLKAKKYPTGGEEQRIKELQKLLKVSRPLPPTPSSLASSSTVKKVTIKQEIRSPVKKAPMLPPAPKYLDPTKGRAFLNTRKQVIEKIYKDLVNGERANPETEAQRIELELATANPNDEKKYINSCATRRMQLQRESTSGIIEVNKNGSSFFFCFHSMYAGMQISELWKRKSGGYGHGRT
ncbi:hypothetical protein B9Z55_009525 [Caenorhabditis nigoni]|uniref:Uncharacterized protein n=1 Tax=Caenorhabditis nigoni TaxID=1611254 RepID=A0A2G5UT51_9PELO|nr:hypothetical protein B9Z55_009525 [Caenorhabditis nigoni]